MNEDEVWRKQIYIVLSGNLDGGSLHACHCEPNVSMHNTHITNENNENWVIFFQLPAHNNQPLDYPTQSAWGYMLKQTYILYNEWEI